jgi:AcrR family transcriptional regulator
MTREHLLAAAADVFAVHGYHGATLDQIAEAAGFTKGAVYSNFSSKADLFLALSAERERRLIEAFAAAAPVDATPAELIAGLRTVYAGADAEERDRNWRLWHEFMLFSLRDPAAHGKLIEQQRAGFALVVDLAQRQCDVLGVEPPVPVELLARIYVALFNGLWQQQAVDPDAVDDETFPAALVFVNQAIAALGSPI